MEEKHPEALRIHLRRHPKFRWEASPIPLTLRMLSAGRAIALRPSHCSIAGAAPSLVGSKMKLTCDQSHARSEHSRPAVDTAARAGFAHLRQPPTAIGGSPSTASSLPSSSPKQQSQAAVPSISPMQQSHAAVPSSSPKQQSQAVSHRHRRVGQRRTSETNRVAAARRRRRLHAHQVRIPAKRRSEWSTRTRQSMQRTRVSLRVRRPEHVPSGSTRTAGKRHGGICQEPRAG